MPLHPRALLVNKTEADVASAIADILGEADLTIMEEVQVIGRVMDSLLHGITKYAIRKERHGNTKTPGDRA